MSTEVDDSDKACPPSVAAAATERRGDTRAGISDVERAGSTSCSVGSIAVYVRFCLRSSGGLLDCSTPMRTASAVLPGRRCTASLNDGVDVEEEVEEEEAAVDDSVGSTGEGGDTDCEKSEIATAGKSSSSSPWWGLNQWRRPPPCAAEVGCIEGEEKEEAASAGVFGGGRGGRRSACDKGCCSGISTIGFDSCSAVGGFIGSGGRGHGNSSPERKAATFGVIVAGRRRMRRCRRLCWGRRRHLRTRRILLTTFKQCCLRVASVKSQGYGLYIYI